MRFILEGKTFIFCVLVLYEVKYVLSLNDTITTPVNNVTKSNSAVCTNNKCIMKCCPEGKYLNVKLVPSKKTKRLRKQRFCDSYKDIREISNWDAKKVFGGHHPELSSFEVVPGIFEKNSTFMKASVNAAGLKEFNAFLTENAVVVLEMPNAYNRFTYIPNERFCLEYKIENDTARNTTYLESGIWVLFETNSNAPISRTSTILMTSAMLVSCFFLLLVLVVYGLLPELRTLGGLILMAYVASLLPAFLLLAIMRMQKHHPIVCLFFTFVIYYFFLASFCWMHVMSYDIWWTFRGYAKARPIHRRGERFKFLMYCLYAWGLPLAVSIALAVLNMVDMRDTPWFVTPKIPTNGCFIEDGEKLVYLYMPMLILIFCNWVFYIMTAFNVWRLSRGTAVLDSAAAGTPQAHRTQLLRFLVYLKLSVVMGLNWVLEVVSYVYPGYSVWFISDFYNILIGVSIFLIFVCKPKILRKLMKLFLMTKSHWRPSQVESVRSNSSSSDSTTSQETQTLQVCTNPKGPGYPMNSI